MKIISGGQTGIDKMALEVARELGLETGGTAPKGWRTELGADLTLKDFGLVEADSSDYSFRTWLNVKDSEATLLFGNMNSSGSSTTIKICKALSKPYKINPTSKEIEEFIGEYDIEILNVAGNRASRFKGNELEKYREILKEGLKNI